MTSYTIVESPIGELVLSGDATALTGLHMGIPAGGVDRAWRRDPAPFAAATEQLEAYFGGELRAFDLPLAPVGTAFQLEVWQALRAIPYGETRSYGELAATLGKPGASRAVGLANGRNPIAVIVPCHRVIGADGSLTGFGGGLPRKRWLLTHEQETASHRQQLALDLP